jgi:4-amino-4-deoxy-L-arabinose transferase-like glycosyltransferase
MSGKESYRSKKYTVEFTVEYFLLLYLAAHMLQIAFPSDGSTIFDEAHYVPASVNTLAGIAANAEHPPLPKIIGAIGIALLGNNWFGWRFPQVLMQIGALYLFYLIAKRFLGDPWALGATMLLGLDTIFFIHGGALLIDMPSFLFGFLAIELYFRKRYGWSAASMGLALTAREMSIFLFATLGVYHIVTNRKTLKPAFKIGSRYLLLTLAVFGGLMFMYDLKYLPPKSVTVTNTMLENTVQNANGSAITTIVGTIQSVSEDLIWNPIAHVLFIAQYHGPQGLVLNQTYAPYQYAWNWILPNDPFNSPTYYRVDVDVATGGIFKHYSPVWYYSQANLPLWYGIWIAIAGLSYAIKTRKEMGTASFMLMGIVSNYLPWVAMSLLVRRIGFNYYMIYTLPFIALGLAFTWKLLPTNIGLKLLSLNLLLAIAFFIWFFPVHPMP